MPRGRMDAPFFFEHEMGDARDNLARGFARLLGPAAGAAVAAGETRVEVAAGSGKKIVLEVADMPPRPFGPVALPVTRVCVTLSGYGAGEAETFRADFDRAFQRGGG